MTSAAIQDIRKLIERCCTGRYPAGIFGKAEGFEPYRNEMKFERSSLSHLIDVWLRDQKVIYLCGASASHAIDEMLADEDDRADSKNIRNPWRPNWNRRSDRTDPTSQAP